jgi:starvation-inducible DNA-binding protein
MDLLARDATWLSAKSQWLTPESAVMQVTTRIDPKRAKELAKGLSKVWSETHTLRLQTRDLQRRLRGPVCNTLLILLDQQQDELRRAEAQLATRVQQVRGGTRARSPLEAYSPVANDGTMLAIDEKVVCLAQAHECAALATRSASRVAEEGDDLLSFKLLAQRAEVHEKAAWMLASMAVGSMVWCELCADRLTCPLSTVRLPQRHGARTRGWS